MPRELTFKQKRFVQNLTEKNLNVTDSMRLAGYNETSVQNYGSQLLRKIQVKQALQKKGLTDNFLMGKMKKMIKIGANSETISADTASRNIELAFRLSGALDNEKQDNNTTNNVYIKELKMLDINGLMAKLDSIDTEVEQITQIVDTEALQGTTEGNSQEDAIPSGVEDATPPATATPNP